MRLSAREAVVLSALSLTPDLPVSKISKAIGIKSQSIYYIERRFLEKGLLVKRPLINYWKLGYQEYSVHFSCTYLKASGKKALVNTLIGLSSITSAYELGGTSQFGIVALSQSTADILALLDKLADLGNVEINQKLLALRCEIVMYRRKYLAVVPELATEISMTSEKTYKPSEGELAVLKACQQYAACSYRDMARLSKIPFSTFQERLNRLREKEVLAGFVYGIRTDKLGFSTFRILISSRGSGQKIREKFRKFAEAEPNIVVFMVYMGNWDFEFFVEVRDMTQLVQLRDRMQRAFVAEISSFSIIPHLQYLKLTPRGNLLALYG